MNKTVNSIKAKTQVAYNKKYYQKEIDDSINSVVYYDFDNDKPVNQNPGFNAGYQNVYITDRTTVREVYHLRKKFGDVPIIAALNFASFTHPGGMFLAGSSAQEESICHASTLFNILSSEKVSKWYKHAGYDDPINQGLYHDCGIYVMDVVFNDEEVGDDVKADIITVAAPFAGKARKFGVSEKDINYAIDTRVASVFRIAKYQKVNILVLGAFGCGVFKCNPEVVATAFKKYLRIYSKDFSKIIFAIPNDGKNYPVFKKILGL